MKDAAAVRKVKILWEDESGATMVEYAIMLGLIAAVCIAIVGTLGLSTDGLFHTVKPGFE